MISLVWEDQKIGNLFFSKSSMKNKNNERHSKRSGLLIWVILEFRPLEDPQRTIFNPLAPSFLSS
jgi:hypothetical protein